MGTKHDKHPEHNEHPSANRPKKWHIAAITPRTNRPKTRHNAQTHLTNTPDEHSARHDLRTKTRDFSFVCVGWNSPFRTVMQSFFYPICPRCSLLLFCVLSLPDGLERERVRRLTLSQREGLPHTHPSFPDYFFLFSASR